METAKLVKLIAENNERREYQTLREAESVIGQIVHEQGVIKASQEKIEKLRKELADLNVQTLDAREVLGA